MRGSLKSDRATGEYGGGDAQELYGMTQSQMLRIHLPVVNISQSTVRVRLTILKLRRQR